MTPQQWTRVKSIVLEAMDLKPPERDGYIARACEDDTKILREVDSLLKADDEHTIAPPIVAASGAASLPDSGGSMLVGRRVGRYRITRMIGMGGMGAVYEATREDLARPVALKVMRAGLISAAATARFQREANLLSRLDHPGIARIYDSGMHESELGPIPYFAMELIPEAIALTQFAKERKLSIRDRVEIFAGVCDAVHHGHQRGIIHRDLKPSNILVPGSAGLVAPLGSDAAGSSTHQSAQVFAAKVIDFGVARSTDADMTLASFESAPSGMAGTLAYMSPEQCAFDPADIDTRSDVYGLGVVLYELLVGKLPYDVSEKSLPEAIRIIQESPVAKPGLIEPILGSDLSVILLKCLAKERGLRYDSASELAEDLRRWLTDLPIAARPASRMYAVRLFARRNRPLVIAGTIAACAVLVGLASTSIALHRAVLERDRARDAEALAREQQIRTDRVAEFVQGVLRSTSAPMLASQLYDPEISPIAAGNVAVTPALAVTGKVESLRDVVERARVSLSSVAMHDAKLAAELRLLTLQLLITQTGTSQQNNEIMDTGPDEIRAAAREIGAMHPRVLATSLMLSGMMSGSGLLDEASRLVREQYVAAREELGAGDSRTLELGRQLVRLLEREDLAEERRTLVSQIVYDAAAQHGEDSRISLACRLEAARAAVGEGRLSESGNAGREVLARLGPAARDTDDLVVPALELSISDVPRIPARIESLKRIEEIQRRVLHAVRDRSGNDARVTFDAATSLVSTLVQLGEFKQAAAVMQEVATVAESSLGPTFHVTTKSQSRVARLMVWGGGDLNEALKLANAAAINSVRNSGQPLGDYEVFDRATVFDVRRALGEPQLALEGVDQLIRAYQAASGNHLSWFGGYLHNIAAQALAQMGKVNEARTRWLQAIEESEALPQANVLRVMVLREAGRFFSKHGPVDRSIALKAALQDCYVGEP